MKVCEACRKAPATVFLKIAVNNKVAGAHLCAACAARKGAAFTAADGVFNVSDMVGNLSGYFSDFLPAGGRTLVCGGCGLRYAQFRETGRLGCAACYKSFEPQLTELMERIHGAARHSGRAYAGCTTGKAAKAARAKRAGELKAAVRAAVAKEDFELAARLRDALRALEAR